MKSILIYYTQTRAALDAVKAVQRGIERITGQCDLAAIDSLKPEALKDYDLIGISSPLWGNHLPLNVRHFIARLPDEVAGKRAFFFYNEQIAFGYSLIRAVQALREKGLVILGWNDRRGAFHLSWSPSSTDPSDLQDAASFGAAVAAGSQRYANCDAAQLFPILSTEVADSLYGIGGFL